MAASILALISPPATIRPVRRRGALLAVTAWALIALLFAFPPSADAQQQRAASARDADADNNNPVLVGKVLKVTDGDTLKVQLSSGPINVRFDGIDAPEHNQPHGAEATAALTRLVANQTVQLDVRSQDRYERLVAVVFVGDLNVNERLVQGGHAWAYRQYLKKRDGSGVRFCNWEAAARSARRGIWSLPADNWIYPSDWRRWKRGDRDTVEDFSKETAARCIAAIAQNRPKAPRTARTE